MSTASLIVNFGLVVMIWLVQLIIYPSFYEIEESRFADWHRLYTKRISYVVIPLMILQVILLIYFLTQEGIGPVRVLQSVLITAAWGITFFVSVRCHNRLSIGKEKSAIRRLVSTNWYRTAAWTLVPVLDCIALAA